MSVIGASRRFELQPLALALASVFASAVALLVLVGVAPLDSVVGRVLGLSLGASIGMAAIPLLRERLGWIPILIVLFLLRPGVLGGPVTFTFISGVSMEPAMHTGDLAVLVRQDSYRVGDVVAYHPAQAPDGLIIHRIVGGDAGSGYAIRGDNRSSDDYDRPTARQLLGRAVLVLPSVGWFFAGLRVPVLLGFVVALLAMWLAWDYLFEPKKKEGLT